MRTLVKSSVSRGDRCGPGSTVGNGGSAVDGEATAAVGQGVTTEAIAALSRRAGGRAHGAAASLAEAAPGGRSPVDRDASVAAVTPSAYSVDAHGGTSINSV